MALGAKMGSSGGFSKGLLEASSSSLSLHQQQQSCPSRVSGCLAWLSCPESSTGWEEEEISEQRTSLPEIGLCQGGGRETVLLHRPIENMTQHTLALSLTATYLPWLPAVTALPGLYIVGQIPSWC